MQRGGEKGNLVICGDTWKGIRSHLKWPKRICETSKNESKGEEPWETWNEQGDSSIFPAYFLERISGVQCGKWDPGQSLAGSTSRRGRAERPGAQRIRSWQDKILERQELHRRMAWEVCWDFPSNTRLNTDQQRPLRKWLEARKRTTLENESPAWHSVGGCACFHQPRWNASRVTGHELEHSERFAPITRSNHPTPNTTLVSNNTKPKGLNCNQAPLNCF